MVTASDFRDSQMVALLVGYGEQCSERFARITVRQHDGTEATYSVDGLTAWHAFEDFGALDISHCTLLVGPADASLCLDPFLEGERSDEDNFWFAGTSVSHAPGANNSFKPTPLRGAA